MSAPDGDGRPRDWTPLDRLAERHLDALAELDPIVATLQGIDDGSGRMTDFSPAGHAARAAEARRTLTELAGLPVLDEVDAVTGGALRERLEASLALYDAGLDEAGLNNIASPVQLVREVFDVAPTATAADWEAIRNRLRGIPGALDGVRESLRLAATRPTGPPRRQVVNAAGQCADFGRPDGFFTRLAEAAAPADGPPLPGPLRAELAHAATLAARAYVRFGDWLREELLPGAGEDDACGRELYPLVSQAFLGTAVDLDETYAWGLDEVDRIEAELARTARLVAPDAPGERVVEAAIEALDTDPARTIAGAEAFRDWMQGLSDAALRDLGDSHFEIPPVLRNLTCRIAPSTSGAIYYTAPNEDLSRPGQMWWAVPEGMVTFSTWRETSTVYHEGVPGHHLQIAGTIHLREHLNRWRRLGCWVSGHGEGWALYAERLMAELGYLDDPGDRMGQLDAQALRACRVVVDIGVHCRLPAPAEVGGGTWDAEKAWRYLRAHTRLHDPMLRFELDRYLGWPGQAPAYKVGERVWLDLRRTVQEQEGDRFDLREFHRRALGMGSVGLDVLCRAMAAAPGTVAR